jgi:hypothetical protein
MSGHSDALERQAVGLVRPRRSESYSITYEAAIYRACAVAWGVLFDAHHPIVTQTD